jgi:hypothetical protein
MVCNVLLTTFAFVSLTGQALAQPVTLQWKFKEGETFFLEEKVLSDTTYTVNGQTTTEKRQQNRLSGFMVKSVTADVIVLEQRIESWQINSKGGSGGGLGDDGKILETAYKDVVFQVKINRNGTIVKFDGYDKFLKQLCDASPAEAELFKTMFPEDVLRAPLALALDVLPDKAINKGDKWRKTCDVPLGVLGKIIFTSDLTYDGKGKDGSLISSKGTFAFQLGKGDLGMGVKLVKLDLSKNEHTSKIVFDADKGRLVVQDLTMPLVGTLTMEVGGAQIDIQLNGVENRTTRLHSKKPLPEN